LDAFILGLLQGFTEFLPVSSSGHLVMGQALLNVRIPGVAFEVAVHVATLLSVLVVFRHRLWALVAGAVRLDGEAWRYIGLLGLGTVPAAVVGLGAKDLLESLFEDPVVVGFALLVTGSFLWTSRSAMARNPQAKPSLRAAVVMGLAQAFAIIPGISRSGATVVAGLWMGVEAEEAAAFSFLLAIPAILGAAVLELPGLLGGESAPGGNLSGVGGVPAGPLLLGGLVAALAGILAIWTFVIMLKRRSFHRFGPYCWGVGSLFLLYLFLRG
jgi:undecaprenyl-diphosphatase